MCGRISKPMESFLADLSKDERISNQLMQVRQGGTSARKQLSRDLAAIDDPSVLVSAISPMLREPQLDEAELIRMLKLLVKLFSRWPPLSLAENLSEVVVQFASAIKLHVNLDESQAVLQAFLRVVGLRAFINCLRPAFNTTVDVERLQTATCLAVAAQFVGVPLILPLMRALINDKDQKLQLLGLTVVQKMPVVLKRMTVLPFLGALVGLCRSSLNDPVLSTAANPALVVLADCAAPYGYGSFEQVIDEVWAGARGKRGKLAFLRALAAIAATTNSETSAGTEIAESVFIILEKELQFTPPSADRVCLNILRRCSPFIRKPDLQTRFVDLVFTRFWTPEAARSVQALSLLPTSATSLITSMIEHNAFAVPDLAVDLLARKCPTKLALDSRTEQLLAENVIQCLMSPQVAKALKGLAESVSSKYLAVWVTDLLNTASDPSAEIRASAFRALAAISSLLPIEEQQRLYTKLYEELGEEYPEVLAEVMNCLLGLASVAQADSLLPRLTPILRNRNETVQEQCTKLVRTLAETSGEIVAAREWMQCCFELLELQKSQRQTTRYEATRAFAAISSVVGPADVVITLVNHLKSPDRQFRVTTAAAIASIANETGAFAILPVLLHEYSTDDIVIQHGVLKSLSFMAQFIDASDLRPLVTSLTLVLDNALLDSNQVHRQTAASIIHFMAQACVGYGYEKLFVHFLNELWPSIFETSPHVIDRIVEAITSISEVMGIASFANYCWAGLFHPSRKVRNIYWRLWNAVYIKAGDALVPVYPVHVEDPVNPEADIRDVWI